MVDDAFSAGIISNAKCHCIRVDHGLWKLVGQILVGIQIQGMVIVLLGVKVIRHRLQYQQNFLVYHIKEELLKLLEM